MDGKPERETFGKQRRPVVSKVPYWQIHLETMAHVMPRIHVHLWLRVPNDGFNPRDGQPENKSRNPFGIRIKDGF